MSRLTKNLKKYFFIETASLKLKGMQIYQANYIVWYPNYFTFLIFGRKYTVIFGLNHYMTGDITEANRFIKEQKMLYKVALLSKRR